MKARWTARLIATSVLLAAGAYYVVYLWRWEWNRAIVAGIVFLAVELGTGIAILVERLGAQSQILRRAPAPVLARIRQAAPPPPSRFEWLSPRNGHTGVFVPVLLGMGVLVSAVAWLVERMARATAGPVLERGLAARLAHLSWPTQGLIGPDREPLALLTGPGARP